VLSVYLNVRIIPMQLTVSYAKLVVCTSVDYYADELIIDISNALHI